MKLEDFPAGARKLSGGGESVRVSTVLPSVAVVFL